MDGKMTKLPKRLEEMRDNLVEQRLPSKFGPYNREPDMLRIGFDAGALAVLTEAEKVVESMRELRTEWLESKGELPEKMKTKLNQADFALADWQKFVGVEE